MCSFNNCWRQQTQPNDTNTNQGASTTVCVFVQEPNRTKPTHVQLSTVTCQPLVLCVCSPRTMSSCIAPHQTQQPLNDVKATMHTRGYEDIVTVGVQINPVLWLQTPQPLRHVQMPRVTRPTKSEFAVHMHMNVWNRGQHPLRHVQMPHHAHVLKSECVAITNTLIQ